MNSPVSPVSRVNPDVHLLLLLLCFWGFVGAYMPAGGGDLNFWTDWVVFMQQHGIRHIYDLHRHPGLGQPPSFLYGPVYMYLLYFYGKWQGTVAEIEHNIHQVKIIILIFDMVGIWFALRYLQQKANRPFYALFLIFNVSLLYNTISWGQVDGAIACLTLVALYYALRGQMALSGISFIMALLIKPQPIIFLPVLGLLWLTSTLKSSVKHTALSFLGVALCTVVLLWPFLQAGTFVDYWSMLLDSPNVYSSVTVNAANIWTLFLTEDPDQVSNGIVRLGLSYKQWGLLMFSVGFFVILFPMVRQFYQIVKGKRTQYDTSLVLLTAGLVPIVFYFFNTQMHERYAHPSVLLLAAYALSKRDFVPYVVASIANFWVMDKFLKNFGLYDHISLELIAALFLCVLVWGVVQLYRKSRSVKREIALV